jgi:hypothetical protein
MPLSNVCTSTQGPERTFFTHKYKVKMSVYMTRPLSFDLAMCVAVAAYLFSILVIMLGPEEALKAVSDLFKKNNKKVKR